MTSVLLIRKTEGEFENILVRNVQTRVAAHIQLPVCDQNRRVVVAMPAGKTAHCFETTQPAAWILDGDPETFAADDGQCGVRFTLATHQTEVVIPSSSILLNHTLMARFGIDPEHKNEAVLREKIESGEIRDIESRLGMDLSDLAGRGIVIGPEPDPNSNTVTFTRRAWDGKHHYRLQLAGDSSVNIHLSDDTIRFTQSKPDTPLRLTVSASTDFERLTPMPLNELLNPQGLKLIQNDPQFAEAMHNFEFLSYREKYLAGSWNFFSYFGRDTLIALRVMWPVLSAQAKQTGIQSVANETAENGIVNVTDEWMHDRTLANGIEVFFRAMQREDLDEARQVMTGILEGTIPEYPFLDVLDQTYMAPSAAFLWLSELDDDAFTRWFHAEHAVLNRTETNLLTLARNWNFILESASPYIEAWRNLRAAHPGLTPQQLIETHPQEFRETSRTLVSSIAGAANWRDTYNLPWHFFSEDINVNLLPLAIEAIQKLIARLDSIGCRGELLDLTQTHSLNALHACRENPERLQTAADTWNWDLMREHFLIRRTAAEIRENLDRYLEGMKNGDAFFGDKARGTLEQETILRSRVDGIPVSEYLAENRLPDAVKNGIEFTALLLDTEGHPLPLMHSDDVYLALFGTPSMERFRKICRLFALPYPFGLSFFGDDIGFAITHALYAPRDHAAFQDSWKNTWVKFGPEEYHGRAAWPWVLFALLNGIRDQLLRGITPDGQLENGLTADDVELLRFLLEKSKVSLKKLGPLATSEVYKFGPAQTEDSTWQAEPMGISTPIQLWSAAPANLLIDEALAQISRFRQS